MEKNRALGNKHARTYCFFASHYLPHLGGVERYVYNISQKLIGIGNKVIVITSSMEDAQWKDVRDGILIYRLPSIPLLKGRFPVLKQNRQTRRILEEIRKERIDYMVVNTRFYLLSYFAVAYAQARNCPAIVIEHGTGHFTVNHKALDALGHLYEHLITAMVKSKNARFYGVSRECCRWLGHFKIHAQGVLYNAVDVQKIGLLCKEKDTELEERIGYDPSHILITYTGRLVREKGILKLVAAVKKARQYCPQVKLCIAGDGDLYQEVKKQQGESVIVLGTLSFEKVIHLLHLTDIFCLPTDYPEGLPTSVLEAIAAKAYVITTEAGGSKEVITDGSYGTVLKENTADRIAKEILTCVKEPVQRRRCVEQAYERVCRAFTWEKTAWELEKIFQRL